jgi:DNA (cytosine-5)-methyltransferase 1
MDFEGFRQWLISNKEYSRETISNIVSRVKRANSILPWYNEVVYQFMLEREQKYQGLSCSVRSQIKKAVKLYFDFVEDKITKEGGN